MEHIYSLLCVISQYQEYMAGRGTATDDYEYRVSILTVSQRKQERDKGRKVKCTNCIVQLLLCNTSQKLENRKVELASEI